MRVGALLAVVLLAVNSCAMMSTKLGIRQEGEMRLVRLSVPETMQRDLPYKVHVAFEADGRPEIRNVCFQWLSVKAQVKSPNLYCYAQEVQSNQPIGSVCGPLVDEGIYSGISPVSCSKPEIVTQGSVTVTLDAANVKPYYNALECRVDYVQGGEVRQSNKISARVIVETSAE